MHCVSQDTKSVDQMAILSWVENHEHGCQNDGYIQEKQDVHVGQNTRSAAVGHTQLSSKSWDTKVTMTGMFSGSRMSTQAQSTKSAVVGPEQRLGSHHDGYVQQQQNDCAAQNKYSLYTCGSWPDFPEWQVKIDAFGDSDAAEWHVDVTLYVTLIWPYHNSTPVYIHIQE